MAGEENVQVSLDFEVNVADTSRDLDTLIARANELDAALSKAGKQLAEASQSSSGAAAKAAEFQVQQLRQERQNLERVISVASGGSGVGGAERQIRGLEDAMTDVERREAEMRSALSAFERAAYRTFNAAKAGATDLSTQVDDATRSYQRLVEVQEKFGQTVPEGATEQLAQVRTVAERARERAPSDAGPGAESGMDRALGVLKKDLETGSPLDDAADTFVNNLTDAVAEAIENGDLDPTQAAVDKYLRDAIAKTMTEAGGGAELMDLVATGAPTADILDAAMNRDRNAPDASTGADAGLLSPRARNAITFEATESILAALMRNIPFLGQVMGSERAMGGMLRQTAAQMGPETGPMEAMGTLGRAGLGALGSKFGGGVGMGAAVLGGGALALGGAVAGGIGLNRFIQPQRRDRQMTEVTNEMRAGFEGVFGGGAIEASREFAESLRRARVELDPMTDSFAELASDVGRLAKAGIMGIDAVMPTPEEMAALLAESLQVGIGTRMAGGSAEDALRMKSQAEAMAMEMARQLPGGSENLDETAPAVAKALEGDFTAMANLGFVVDQHELTQERSTEAFRNLAAVNPELAEREARAAAAQAAIDRAGRLDTSPAGHEFTARQEGTSMIDRAAGARVRRGVTDVVAAGGGLEEVMAMLEEMEGAVDNLSTEGAAREILKDFNEGVEGAQERLVLLIEAMQETGDAFFQGGHLINATTGELILSKGEMSEFIHLLDDVSDGWTEVEIAQMRAFGAMERQRDLLRINRDSLGGYADAVRDAQEALADYRQEAAQPFTPDIDPLVEAEKMKAVEENLKAERRAQRDHNEQLADIFDSRNESLEDANEMFTESMEDLAEATEDAQERVLGAFQAQDRIDLGSIRNRGVEFLINNARRQNELIAEAQAGREELRARGMSEAAMEELGLDELTPEAVGQIRMLLRASAEELDEFNQIMGEKGELAKKELTDPLSEAAEDLAEREQDILEAHTEAVEDINERFNRAIRDFLRQTADAGLFVAEMVQAIDDGANIRITLPQAGERLDPSFNDPAVDGANRRGGSTSTTTTSTQTNTTTIGPVYVTAEDPAELQRKLEDIQREQGLLSGGGVQL